MNILEEVSTETLRRRARKFGVSIRKVRNWNRRLGNDGFVPLDIERNCWLLHEPLDEKGIREWLIEFLA